MNTLGRILVLTTFLLSMLLMTWSIALYTQRLEWFSRTTEDGEQIRGRIDTLRDQIEDEVRYTERGEYAWRVGLQGLRQEEVQRPLRQRWYQDFLSMLETGQWRGQPVQNPVRELSLPLQYSDPSDPNTPSMPPILDNITGKPQPLRALNYYFNAIKQQQSDIQAIQQEISQLLEESKRLDQEILGGPNVRKGLRQRIKESEEILADLINEIEYLQPSITNGRAESEVLLKRLRSLQNRLSEVNQAQNPDTGR